MIKQKKLVNKSDISDLVKNSDLNTKLAILAVEAELKAEQDKIMKLKAHGLVIFLVRTFLVMLVFEIYLFINQHLIH